MKDWKHLEHPISESIKYSTVTKVLKIERGMWEEYEGIDTLSMQNAESMLLYYKWIVAVQNKEGIIFDQIVSTDESLATGWMQPIEEKPKHLPNHIQKAIYEIQQSLHQIDKTLDEIRTNAKDSF